MRKIVVDIYKYLFYVKLYETMKYINYWRLLLMIIIVNFLFIESKAGTYVGLGGSYNLPYKNLENFNENSVGYRLELISRSYCNLWFGVKADYINYKPKGQIVPSIKDALLIQPEIKYAPFVEHQYNGKIIPYLQGNLTLSSIKSTDRQDQFGFGYGLGLGVCYGFKLFDKCFMVDLDGLYSLPNNIYKDDNRMKIETINIGLTLSMDL